MEQKSSSACTEFPKTKIAICRAAIRRQSVFRSHQAQKGGSMSTAHSRVLELVLPSSHRTRPLIFIVVSVGRSDKAILKIIVQPVEGAVLKLSPIADRHAWRSSLNCLSGVWSCWACRSSKVFPCCPSSVSSGFCYIILFSHLA